MRPHSVQHLIDDLDRRISRLQAKQDQSKPVWDVASVRNAKALNGSTLQVLEDQSILATGLNPAVETYEVTTRIDHRRPTTAIQIEFLPARYHSGNVGRGNDGSFVLSRVRVFTTTETGGVKLPVNLADAAADFSQKGLGPENLIRNRFDKQSEPHGWAVQDGNKGFRKRHFVIVEFETPVSEPKQTELTVQLIFQSQWPHRNAGRIRLSTTDIDQPVEKFRKKQLDPLEQQINQLIKQRNQPVRVPVLLELPKDKRRETHLMKRGNFQNPGKRVQAQTPVAFHPFPASASRDRLGLAEWLVDSNNPLTARVTVNRLWARLFGKESW